MENGKVQPRKMASEAFVLALTSHIRKRSVHQRMHGFSPDAFPIVDQHVFHEAESQERSWPRLYEYAQKEISCTIGTSPP